MASLRADGTEALVPPGHGRLTDYYHRYKHALRPLAMWERGIALAGALTLIDPGLITDLIGSILVAFVAIRQIRSKLAQRRQAGLVKPKVAGQL